MIRPSLKPAASRPGPDLPRLIDKACAAHRDGDLAAADRFYRAVLARDPGNVDVRVTYILTPRDELVVDYTATTDKATPLNLSQHSYWNLHGDDGPDADGDRYFQRGCDHRDTEGRSRWLRLRNGHG